MNNFDKFINICQKVSSWNKKSLPLCAAENAISPFSQIPLDTFLQEKYIMGGILEYNSNNNFIGSSNLYEFYDLINKQCATLFSSKYADPRTLSGVNAVTTLLMSLFKEGDTILISNEDCGGHSSMPKICHTFLMSSSSICTELWVPPLLSAGSKKPSTKAASPITIRTISINPISIPFTYIINLPESRLLSIP